MGMELKRRENIFLLGIRWKSTAGPAKPSTRQEGTHGIGKQHELGDQGAEELKKIHYLKGRFNAKGVVQRGKSKPFKITST